MGFLVLFFVDVRGVRIRRRLLLDKGFHSLSEDGISIEGKEKDVI